ncbi:hypothetical protein [Actinoallomurus sp. NPDC052274]|uniref:hypothetical protein n=1 Tax=Actinoallomurus sp. NPDC052274 TaxID=3155420 RepID=UPI00343E6CE5
MTGRELPDWAKKVSAALTAAEVAGRGELDQVESDLFDLLSMRLRHRLGDLRPDTDTEKRLGLTWAATIAHIGRRVSDALQAEADQGDK